MTQKRTTTYVCDACGKGSSRKADVRRVLLIPSSKSGYSDHARSVGGDLCIDCEDKLVEAVARIFPDQDAEQLRRAPA